MAHSPHSSQATHVYPPRQDGSRASRWWLAVLLGALLLGVIVGLALMRFFAAPLRAPVTVQPGVVARPPRPPVAPPPVVQTRVIQPVIRAALAITPNNFQIGVDQSTHLTAAAYYSLGGRQLGSSEVQWETTNPAVVRVSPDGLATGVGVGDASIIATNPVDGTSARAQVRIVATNDAVQVFVPYLAAGYRYAIVPPGAAQGFQTLEFDDSSFAPGRAGFGQTNGQCPLSNPVSVGTFWPPATDILVRRWFEVPPGWVGGLSVYVASSNPVQLFANGHVLGGGPLQVDGCAAAEQSSYTIHGEDLRPGENLLAIRGVGRSAENFLDVQVIARR